MRTRLHSHSEPASDPCAAWLPCVQQVLTLYTVCAYAAFSQSICSNPSLACSVSGLDPQTIVTEQGQRGGGTRAQDQGNRPRLPHFHTLFYCFPFCTPSFLPYLGLESDHVLFHAQGHAVCTCVSVGIG